MVLVVTEESSMENQVNNNKFSWVIKNFSSFESDTIYSDPFVIGRCKWRLRAYPWGKNNNKYLSLYLCVVEPKALPCGWRRHAKYSFMIVNRIPGRFSKLLEGQHWLSEKEHCRGFDFPISLNELNAKDSGFLVNGELKIVVDVKVLEVVGPLDVPKVTSSGKETVDVNGFQVFPSQVESVRRVFDKHPDVALQFRAKNQLLRTSCMNILLSLIGTLRQSLRELSNDDLVEADLSLIHLKHSGFEVDWLERKLKEAKEKKKEEQSLETRVQGLEKELKDFKLKRLAIEAQLEKDKAKVLASMTPLTLDDFL